MRTRPSALSFSLDEEASFLKEQIHEKMQGECTYPQYPDRFSFGIESKEQQSKNNNRYRDEDEMGKNLIGHEGVK